MTARLLRSNTFRSFRGHNFRIYFAGQAISQIGSWLQLIAQTILMLRLEGTAVALGALVALQFLPVLLFGPFSGVLADRLDKRRLLMVTQSLMMIPALLLGTLTISGHITTAWLLVLATMTGVGTAFDNPPRRTILSELVEPEDVTNAVSLNSTLMTGARLIAPAVAGLLIVTVGIGWCFIVNSLSFIAGLIAVKRLDTTAMNPARVVPRSKGQIREGLAYLWGDRELRIAMSVMVVVSTLAFNWPVVLPIFARVTLNGGERTYLVLSAVVSFGSLIGALLIARRREIVLVTVIRTGLALGVIMAIFAASPTLWMALLLAPFLGGCGIAYLSSTASLLQIRSDPSMRGRVVALHAVVFLGSTPIGGPVAGFVTQQFGPRVGLLLGAVPTMVAASIALMAVARRPLIPRVEPSATSAQLIGAQMNDAEVASGRPVLGVSLTRRRRAA